MINTLLRAKIHEQYNRRKRSQPVILTFLEGKTLQTVECCDFCGCNDIVIISDRDRYGAPIRAAQCNRCALIFLVDRLSREDYAKFYEDVYRPLVSAYLGRPVTPDSLGAEQKVYVTNVLNIVRGVPLGTNNGQKSRLLDVGGSTGVIASAVVRKLNCVATVLDPSSAELQVAASAGHETIHALLEDWIPQDEDKYDLTFCCKTIDHFLDLRRSLAKLKDVTKHDGRVFIDIIDFDGVWERTGMVEGAIKIDHCYYLSSENAPAILRNVGLEPVFSEVASHPEHVSYICKAGASTDIPVEVSDRARVRLRAIQKSRVEVTEAARIPYTWLDKALMRKRQLLRFLKTVGKSHRQ